MSKNSSYDIDKRSWNKWARFTCAHLFLFLGLNVKAQNLVPNGNFEDTLCCPGPGFGSQIWCANHWFSPTNGTSDFFHLCNWEEANGPGFMGESVLDEKAQNGMAGFYNFAQTLDFSEYLAVKLTDSLLEGKIYQLSADLKATYPYWASDAVDFYFSKDSIYEVTWFLAGKTPQVSNPSGNIIADSVNWFTLVDTFKAEGGERYLNVGSFRLGSNTQYSMGAMTTFPQAYVVIDNIKLVEYVPETPIPEPLPFNVFPNPNNGHFTVTYTLDSAAIHEMRFYNAIGQLVYTTALDPHIYTANLDLSKLGAGMYAYSLFSGSRKTRNGKLLIIK